MSLAESKLIKETKSPNFTGLGFEIKGKNTFKKTYLASLDKTQKEK